MLKQLGIKKSVIYTISFIKCILQFVRAEVLSQKVFSILSHPQNNEPNHCKDGTKLQILSGITPPLLGNLSLNLEYKLVKLIFSNSTK